MYNTMIFGTPSTRVLQYRYCNTGTKTAAELLQYKINTGSMLAKSIPRCRIAILLQYGILGHAYQYEQHLGMIYVQAAYDYAIVH